jgi:ribosomal-protein-alanine N-acetyltransferase
MTGERAPDIAPVDTAWADRLAELQAGWWRGSAWVERPWKGEAWRSVLAMPGCFALVAACDGRETGFVAARVAADEAELLMIGVDPAARCRGVGRSLLAAAMAAACGAGAARMVLEVAEPNAPALALYRAAGFEVVGRRTDYYEFPNCSAAAAIMARRLAG